MRYIAIEVYKNRDVVSVTSAVEVTPYAHRYEDYDEVEFVKEYENGVRLYSVLRDDNETYYVDTFLIPEDHPLFNFYPLYYWDEQTGMNMFPMSVTNEVMEIVIEELTKLKKTKE